MKHKKKRKTKKEKRRETNVYVTYVEPGRPKPRVRNVASGGGRETSRRRARETLDKCSGPKNFRKQDSPNKKIL